MARTTRSARRSSFLALATLVALSGAAIGGCNSGAHGKYTGEQLTAAKLKMDMLKSGTEWNMAQQQFLAGDLDKSLKTVDRSIALNPNVAKSHVLRGRVMLEKSRLEEARAEFLEAEKIDPQFVEAQYYLGIVHERVGEFDQALVRYHKAMDLDHGSAQYVVAAAEMLVSQNKLDQADALLLERKQYMQYNPAIRQTMGQVAQLRGDNEKAVTLFHEALLLAPGDQGITEDLVQAQMATGKFAEADSLLAKLLDQDANKNRRDLKSMRARCLMAINQPVEARELLQAITSDRDGSADLRAWIDLGNVAAILHDKSNLAQSMRRVIALAPTRPEGYMLKAMYCRQDNRLSDAMIAVDQAVAKSKNDGAAYVLKAIIQQDQGQIVQARETLAAGQKIDPANREIAALMGSFDRRIAGENTETH